MTEQEELEVIRLCESTYYCEGVGRPRSLIYGVGINDAPFITQISIGKKRRGHPAYVMWKSMLDRCYSEQTKNNFTYYDCEVDNSWFSFMNFYSFWENNYKYGYELDKDILIKGNKIYSSEHCIMIPSWVNLIISVKRKINGLPIGVSLNKNKQRYSADICLYGRKKNLGVYNSPIEANQAWFTVKLKYLNERKRELDDIDSRLFTGLFHKIESLRIKS